MSNRLVLPSRRLMAAVLTAALAGLVGSCGDSGTEPSTSQKVTLHVSADVGSGAAGQSVALRAYYLRTDGSEVPIAIQPATMAVSNASTVTGDVSAEVGPCLRDANREIAVGLSAGCRVHVAARLLLGNGTELSTDESSIVVMPRSGPLTVDAFTLPSGALLSAASTVDFTMTESGQIPAARTIAISSSTAAPTGVLSASIEYVSGTGWLTATIPAGQSALTLSPATTPAPGRYEAIVRVTSTVLAPAEIRVAYIIPQPPKNVTITGAGNGSGLVLVTPNGTTCTTTAGQASGFCTVPAPHGSTVTLTASPAVGSVFTGWTGACQGTGACTLVMDVGRQVTATFTLLKRQLTIDAAGAGSGVITSSPSGISCTASSGTKTGTCAAEFDHPTEVTLTATPNSATSVFTGWGGACSGTGTCVVAMTEARNVTATFGLLERSLTVSMLGGGTGTVTSSPAGVACTMTNGQTGGTCTAGFPHGTSVVLTVAPGTDMVFAGWGGACTGTGTCTVTMDQARSVTATIRPPLYAVTVQVTGNGNGGAFGCPYSGQPLSCTREFAAGTVLDIVVSTSDFFGSVNFSAGVDVCSHGQSTSCRITVTGPRTLTASITVPTVTVTVLGGGTGSGTVSSVPSGIQCTVSGGQTSGTCQADFVMTRTYPQVTLNAVPAAGSVFSGFAGCSSSRPDSCDIGFSGATSVTAAFGLIPRELTVTVGPGAGTVTSAPAGISCASTTGFTATCKAPFDNGTAVTLTAVPAANMTFAGWSGSGCTGTGTCTVTMDQARSVTANITSPLETLSITSSGNGFATVRFFAPSGPECTVGQGSGCTRQVPAGSEAEIYVESENSQGSLSLTGCDRFYGGGLAQGCFVRMNGGRTVNVAVNRPSTSVTVVGSGSGAGRVTDQYIDCRIAAGVASGVCSSNLYGRNEATLTATPEPGSTFTGWTNCSVISGNTCTIGILDSRTVTATFTLSPQVPLNITVTGNAPGFVRFEPERD